jgi:hypothetical protein
MEEGREGSVVQQQRCCWGRTHRAQLENAMGTANFSFITIHPISPLITRTKDSFNLTCKKNIT